MRPDVLLVSNNPLLRDKYVDKMPFVFIAGAAVDVLRTARDMAHRGRRVVSDPAASRLGHRPNPYCTVFLTGEAGAPDLFSLTCLEHALFREEKHPAADYDAATLRDFQLVELALAESALVKLE